MDENVDVTAGARTWLVEHSRARGLERGDSGRKIGHAQRNVVEAGTALGEEVGYGRIGGGGLEELDARIAGGEHGDRDLLLRDFFAVRGEPKRFVEREGLVERVDGDAEVI